MAGIPKKDREVKPWGIINDALVDIFNGLKIFKTSRDYFNVCYFGTRAELRKACQRIINVLDSMDKVEQEQRKEDELDAEIRRKEVYPGAFVGRYRRRNRDT